MKIKLFVAAIMLMCLHQGSMAQVSTSIGIKGGLNVAGLSNRHQIPDNRMGYHAGVFANVKLTHFAVQAEVLYSTQGGDSTGLKVELTYLNLPVLLKYSVTPVFNLQGGLQYGILLNGTVNGSDYIKDSLNASDVSLCLGAGLTIQKLIFDARYNLGLTSAYKIGDESKNQVFQISVGYRLFDLK